MFNRNNNLITLVFFLLLARTIDAQVIPTERLVDWHVAGLEQSFDLPQTQLNILDFGVLADGLANDAPAIQAALNNVNGQSTVFHFPPGTYLLNNPISIPDSIILQGSTSDSTVLLFNLGNLASNCINLSGGSGGSFQSILSEYNFNSDKIVCASTSNFMAGDYAEIRQQNGTWDTNPISWANYSVGQMVRITGKSGDTLFLKNPLRIAYDGSLNPEIRKINPRKNSGIECLKIVRQDEPETGAGSNINLSYAVNCRISGVESDHSVGAHINMHYCSNIEVSGCYIHDAFTYDGSGTRGYGVCMSMHTSECLIENNIFKHLRHAMMVKTGSNGNVFSYNYSIEPNRSETINDFSGDISLHGHFAYANLFEGNICQNIIIDHYWGPSGPRNTFLRNRAEWYGLIMTDDNGYSTDIQNYVGNEITENGNNFLIQLWYGLYYVLSGNNHFEWGNNSDGEIIPSGTATLDYNSLYLDYVPEFWTEDISWPSIGYPNILDSGTIPAKERYLSGDIKTICPITKITQTITIPSGWSGISAYVFPYPKNIEALFEPINQRIEIMYNYDGVFYPNQNVNTIGNWDWQNGYIVKTIENCEIEFIGEDCSNNEITLADGWNILPVLSKTPIMTDSLDARFSDQILLIKEIADIKVWWPAQNIHTLKWLIPGKAYLIKANIQE